MNWWWWCQQHRWSPSRTAGPGSHQQCFCTEAPQLLLLLILLPNIIEVLSLYKKQPDWVTVAAPETGPFWKCLRFFKREEGDKAVCRKQVSKMGSKQWSRSYHCIGRMIIQWKPRISLSGLSDLEHHVLPWHTSCQHIADTVHASSSPHKKLQLSISLLLLGKTVFAGGFRTLSELVRW